MSDNPVNDVLQQVVSQNQQPDPGQSAEIEQKTADLKQEKAIQDQNRLVNWVLAATLPLAVVGYYTIITFVTGLIVYPVATAVITGLVVAAISGVIIYQFRKHTASYLEVWAKRKTAESAQ